VGQEHEPGACSALQRSALSGRRASSPLDFLLISFSAWKPLIAYFDLFNSYFFAITFISRVSPNSRYGNRHDCSTSPGLIRAVLLRLVQVEKRCEPAQTPSK
jgi:hypothetical protein